MKNRVGITYCRTGGRRSDGDQFSSEQRVLGDRTGRNGVHELCLICVCRFSRAGNKRKSCREYVILLFFNDFIHPTYAIKISWTFFFSTIHCVRSKSRKMVVALLKICCYIMILRVSLAMNQNSFHILVHSSFYYYSTIILVKLSGYIIYLALLEVG